MEILSGPSGVHPSASAGLDGAAIYLLHRVHSHLGGGGGSVRIALFDFATAFNTTQPQLLGEKLRLIGAGMSTVFWITGYLTGRPQFVRMDHVTSEVVPQGTVAVSLPFHITHHRFPVRLRIGPPSEVF